MNSKVNSKVYEKVTMYQVIINGDFENNELIKVDEELLEDWDKKRFIINDMFDSYKEALMVKNDFINSCEKLLTSFIKEKEQGKPSFDYISWDELITRQEELLEKAKQTKIVKLEITREIMEG